MTGGPRVQASAPKDDQRSCRQALTQNNKGYGRSKRHYESGLLADAHDVFAKPTHAGFGIPDLRHYLLISDRGLS